MSNATATKSPQPILPTTKPMQDFLDLHKEAIGTIVQASADATAKGAERALAFAKEQVELVMKANAVAFAACEELARLGQGNFEAVAKSGGVLTKGSRDLTESAASLAHAAIDTQIAFARALVGAKSLKEAVDLSSAAAKTNLDKLVAEGAKFTQATTKLAEETLDPLSARVSATVEHVFKAAA